MPLPPPREPSALDTAEYTYEEIAQRLELGRLQVETTEEGSRLHVTHVNAPPCDRRKAQVGAPPEGERRTFRPLNLPTLFPEQGPIQVLLVGGFASEAVLHRPAPFWDDDATGGYLIWQAVGRAGLLHSEDADFALGRGGFWDAAPPRTHSIAMTHAGLRPGRGILNFDHAVHPWNLNRLQTLTEACWNRSRNRLKVVTLGEAARFMMCAITHGMPSIPIHFLPEPTREQLSRNMGNDSAAGLWLDWASELLATESD